jgi:hypothetical protein
MAQMQPLKHAANGTHGWHPGARIFTPQPRVKLLRAPTRKAVTGLADAFKPMRAQLEGAAAWTPGAHHQSSDTTSLKPVPPLITGLAGDPIRATDGGKRRMALGDLLAKLNFLFQREMIACGHTPHSMCQRSPESKVSTMS